MKRQVSFRDPTGRLTRRSGTHEAGRGFPSGGTDGRASGFPERPPRRPRATLKRLSVDCGLLLPAVALFWPVGRLGALQFSDVTETAGIGHLHELDLRLAPRDPEFAFLMAGAVAEDLDGDGLPDLFVTGSNGKPNLLYINQGDGTFAEEAALRGAGQENVYLSPSAADYDSDGDVDLFVSNWAGHHLLLTNDGSGHFEASTTAFPDPVWRGTGAGWADIDGDGLLDLAIGSWSDGTGAASAYDPERRSANIFVYRNEGGGRFSTFQVIPQDWTFAVHFADLDHDGDPDLVAAADFGQTRWFRNNGKGVFLPMGASDVENGMGVASGDVDGDGDVDLFFSSIRDLDEPEANWGTTGNRLLLNDGAGGFGDATEEAGVRDGYWGWGALLADLDNDRDLDLYHVNGWPDPGRNVPAQFGITPACLFVNRGDGTFDEVAALAGDAGDTGNGRGVLPFDYDGDGDLDLFVANNSTVVADGLGGYSIEPGRPVLLRNDSEATGNWLKVRVAGGAGRHVDGHGCRVTVMAGGETLARSIGAANTFNGHGPGRHAHFGLGDEAAAGPIQVSFPNGDEVTVPVAAANVALTVEAPRSRLSNARPAVGESISAAIDEHWIPAAGEAVWLVDGVEHPAPWEISFAEPGSHSVVLELYSDGQRVELLRSERLAVTVVDPGPAHPSVARAWNEQILDAIRIDFPNPPVHARNLFHLSVAMWDAWACYDETAVGYLHREFVPAADPDAARHEAISHAAFRVLSSRYAKSVNQSTTLALLRLQMVDFGYEPEHTSTSGSSPAAVGNRVAATVLAWGDSDRSREATYYDDPSYSPVNEPLVLSGSGAEMLDPNRWQPLQFEVALTQNGQVTSTTQLFVGSHWGGVRPFALEPDPVTPLDPGPPPWLGSDREEEFLDGLLAVIRFSNGLDPSDGEMIDVSPFSRGLNPVGTNDGRGHGTAPNPVTGEPYEPHLVPRGDFGRVIAEYWADGPASETPPGHWNTLANAVSDHAATDFRYRGGGEPLDRLEWDVKLYLALNAALHDAAVAAWGCKRVYDYVRPISAIRHLSGDRRLPETPGLVEAITEESAAPGGRHRALLEAGAAVGEIAILAWGGEPDDPETEATGARWILGEDWLPYQRDTFVTPAFAGYVSGHSTFSRAAAEVLTDFTGSAYFPGGLGTHAVPVGALEFEFGPSVPVTLQWATYYDAADEAGISRLYGGIHVPADDLPGRLMGSVAGKRAFALASKYFDGSIVHEPIAARIRREGGKLVFDVRANPGFYWQMHTGPSPAQLKPVGSYLRIHEREFIREVGIPNESARFYRFAQTPTPPAD